jgi:hypothetical protein
MNTHRRSSDARADHSRNGFRPSTTEPGSTDLRYLDAGWRRSSYLRLQMTSPTTITTPRTIQVWD